MKKLIVAALVACSFAAVAEVAMTHVGNDAYAKKALSPEERAQRREMMMRKTGGIIERKGDGKLLIMNCQSRVADEEVVSRVDKIRYVLKFNTELIKGSWKFGDPVPSGATFVIFLVDDEALPMSLIAVEARWGVVNTSTLKLGNRFSKELTRVVTLLIGAAQSQVKTSPMQNVENAADLDRLLTDGFTADSAAQIFARSKSVGMTRESMTSYVKACQEGWAPAPTNEYQKAIWDQVHELPNNPIKIKYDPKRDK